MRKPLFAVIAVSIVLIAAVFATRQAGNTPNAFSISLEEKNPFTGLTPNVGGEQFQFAIVSDRTGGHRKGVFSKAVQKINLMQPDFVMSVGDLIEGSTTAVANQTQWKELTGYLNQFEMPFFMCGGNHDLASKVKTGSWTENFGRSYYHFNYQNCLFLVLNSYDGEDLPEKTTTFGIRFGPKQQEYAKKTIEANKNVRWTFVFMHAPAWAAADIQKNGFGPIEAALQANDRKYNAYCGHLHVYRKYPRNGRDYYQLATTGGSSSLRGTEYGEFDQIAWITMTKTGPVMANIDLDGVLKEDLTEFETKEDGKVLAIPKGSVPATGKCTLDGKPAIGIEVTFNAEKGGSAGTSRVAADGSFRIFPNRGGEGVKPGTYIATMKPVSPFVIDATAVKPVNPVPAKYRAKETSPFKLTVTADGKNEFQLDMKAE